MSPAIRRGVLAGEQSDVLDRCIAAGATQAEVASICRVCDSTVSRWRSGELAMDVCHVWLLVAAFGSVVVLGVEPRLMPCQPREELIGVAAMAADAAVRFADLDDDERRRAIDTMIARLADARASAVPRG